MDGHDFMLFDRNDGENEQCGSAKLVV
jgi:hypothetical protein